MLGFFIDGLRNRGIKMSVLMDEPETLEGAYQKALSELKWKIWFDARAVCEDESVEISFFPTSSS